jgi:putative transposase
MARPLRIEYPGALYHVTSRGNARQLIFQKDSDREVFLDILGQAVERFQWLCHAYCLMDNHYHLVIETPEGNLSRGMRHLNGVYTQKYNWRHKTTGHVFQGRYKAILVDGDSYLLELCRYVALNPVRVERVKSPENWPWSSCRFTAGLAEPPGFLTTEWILGQFSPNKKKAQNLYRRFVHSGVDKASVWNELKGQIFLGDDRFIKDIVSLAGKEIKEIPKQQRYAGRMTLEELFAVDILEHKEIRDTAIYNAFTKYGYALKEIADYLGVHYSTISRIIKRVERKKCHCKT